MLQSPHKAMADAIIAPVVVPATVSLPAYEDDDGMPELEDLYPLANPTTMTTIATAAVHARSPSPFASFDLMKTATSDIETGTITVNGILWSRRFRASATRGSR